METVRVEAIRELVGRERSLREVSQALHFFATRLSAPVTGAIHITCADESELECSEAFQRGFVTYLLPALKFAQAAPMRLANLGARYEWGAVRIAEDHYALGASVEQYKLMVVKINAHVACEPISAGSFSAGQRIGGQAGGIGGSAGGTSENAPYRLGVWKRYDSDSTCCGALGALLKDSTAPFAGDLRELFTSEGRDRVAELRDETKVDAVHRPLFAAIISARLQARKAVLDIQDYAPISPTFFLVVPCVTVNRQEADTEIVCGAYTIDGREGSREAMYFGLGDDPSGFEVRLSHGLFVISDETSGTERRGRDHRELIKQRWEAQKESHRPRRDERLDRVHEDVQRNKHKDHHHAKLLLSTALPLFAEVAPVPTAILMFAYGAAGIHHAFKIHRLTEKLSGSEDARQILDEIHGKIDQLDPERAEAMVEVLMKEYRK